MVKTGRCRIEYARFSIRQRGKLLKRIRWDNGDEYVSHSHTTFFSKRKKPQLKRTAPYITQQIGVVDRTNRILLHKMKTMLVDMKVERSLWAEAVATACYL